MGLFPIEIEDRLSSKTLQAAKKAIEAATAGKKLASSRFVIPISPHAEAQTKEIIHEVQEAYDHMDWYKVYDTLYEAQITGLVPLNSVSCFANCMMATLQSIDYDYRNTVLQLDSDPYNGDLYTGMAACKLSQHGIADCEALLELAKLCPVRHENAWLFVKRKLDWMKETLGHTKTLISLNLKDSNFMKTVRQNHPELLALQHDIERDIIEFKNATELERYRLAYIWKSTPHLWNMIELTSRDQTSTDSLLLSSELFDLILEYCDLRTVGNIGITCSLAQAKVDDSAAGFSHSARILGLSTEECKRLDVGMPLLNWLLELTHICSSLQSANCWDMSTFSVLLKSSAVTLDPLGPVQLTTSLPPLSIAFRGLFYGLRMLILADPSGKLVQYIVSQSNLHMTLARLSNDHLDLSLIGEILCMIYGLVASAAPDTGLWIRQLVNSGFLSVLRSIVCSVLPYNHDASRLLAYLSFHHLIHPNALEWNRWTPEDVFERHVGLITGIWHFTCSDPPAWLSVSPLPFYATFQIEAHNVQLYHPQSEPGHHFADFETLHNAIGNPISDIDDPEELVVHFKGNGTTFKSHARAKRFEKAAINGRVRIFLDGNASISLVIDGLDYQFDAIHGDSCWLGAGTKNSEDNVALMPFLFWRSSDDFSDANYEKEIAQMRLLEPLLRKEMDDLTTKEPTLKKFDDSDWRNLDNIQNNRIASNILTSSTAFRASYSHYQDVQNAIHIKYGPSAFVPTALRDPSPLPRDEYELDDSYLLRTTILNSLIVQNNRACLHEIHITAHANMQKNLVPLLQALVNFYDTIIPLHSNGGAHNNRKDEQILADFLSLYGPLSSDEIAFNKLKLVEVISKLSSEAPNPDLNEFVAIDALQSIVDTLTAHVDKLALIRYRKDPFTLSNAADRLLSIQLEEDSNHALYSSAQDDGDNSTLLGRMQQRLCLYNNMTAAAMQYQLWSTRLRLYRPSVSPITPPCTLESLLLMIARGILHKPEINEYNDYKEEEFEVTFNSALLPFSVAAAAAARKERNELIIGIILGTSALITGIAAYYLGKHWMRK